MKLAPTLISVKFAQQTVARIFCSALATVTLEMLPARTFVFGKDLTVLTDVLVTSIAREDGRIALLIFVIFVLFPKRMRIM